jgi:hypothetical protein
MNLWFLLLVQKSLDTLWTVVVVIVIFGADFQFLMGATMRNRYNHGIVDDKFSDQSIQDIIINVIKKKKPETIEIWLISFVLIIT